MNETIGVKDRNNDRRRRLKITKKQLKKLDVASKEQIKEEKLKENQIKSIVTVIPLITIGTVFKELTDTKLETKEKQESSSSKVVEIVEQNNISLPETNIDKKIDNLKNREIITRYETKLKEIRLELKNIIYEYNIIVSETEEIYELKIAEELLDKLNIIIKKIEELKNMINIPNMEDFDQNYIYNLITEYLSEFEKNNIVEEIKDSELYIYLSSKLQELEDKTSLISEKLEDKKEDISLYEEQMNVLKEKYNTFDNFNNMLIRFQAEQNSIAKDLEEKLKNAVSIEEKTEVKIRILTEQTHIVRDLIVPQLLIPGVKSSIRTAVAAASLTHIIRNYIRPRTEISHYKVVNVVNYEKDITNSIDDIKKGLRLLKNSKKQLMKLLVEFKEDFKEYFGKVKECDKLLNNLEEILDALREKEDELNIMKENQENMLENNNNKVQVLK